MANDNYENIDIPYNSNLERTDEGLLAGAQSSTGNSSQDEGSNEVISSPNQIGENAITAEQIGDIQITNWIKSRNYKPKSQGFFLRGSDGYIEANKLWIGSGGIIGGKLDIPDTTSADSFHVDALGNMWSGATTLVSAPFSVTNVGTIKAESGTIGGCSLSSDHISSTTFASGPSGNGWIVRDDGSAEFQDVTVRGKISTAVFEKGTISAVSGMVVISSSDILDADMTALDASTVTITGDTTFSANEVIRMKDGPYDEWMLVTDAGSAPVYTVTRDLAADYTSDANPIWKKGTAVVSMGVGTGTKTGFIQLDSTSTNSPYIDIYGRNSNTYNDYGQVTTHLPEVRLGWLKGIVDADVGLNSTDVWGLYSDSVYLKGIINATAGKIGSSTNYWSIGSAGITATSTSADVIINYGKTDFGQFSSNDGFILGYDYSSGGAKLELGTASGGSAIMFTALEAGSGDYTSNISLHNYSNDINSRSLYINREAESTSTVNAIEINGGNTGALNTPGIVDSYSESNYSVWNSLQYKYISTGQSFTGTATKITSCKFWAKKLNYPSGNCYAKLYAHTGTYGSTGVPTGSALATSTAIDGADFPSDYELVTLSFPDGQNYEMTAGTYYCIILEYTGTQGSNGIRIGADNTTPSHSGNKVSYNDTTSTWGYSSSQDIIFYVYGATTTNGGMVGVKISDADVGIGFSTTSAEGKYVIQAPTISHISSETARGYIRIKDSLHNTRYIKVYSGTE